MMFKDKSVWVVGASSGYGAELAKAFAQEGAKVILSARRESELNNIKALIGVNADVLPLDLENPASFPDKTREALTLSGGLDIVVFAGALAQNAKVADIQSAVERRIMAIDYFSYTELTKCLLPHFLERNKGHFVVISGLLARVTLPGRSSYAAAKAALHGYFGCLRTELAHTDIAVTLIVPAALQTDLSSKALQADGSTPSPSKKSTLSGCPLDKAARQSLAAISRKKSEALIGNWDTGFILWKISLFFPNLLSKILAKKAKK